MKYRAASRDVSGIIQLSMPPRNEILNVISHLLAISGEAVPLYYLKTKMKWLWVVSSTFRAWVALWWWSCKYKYQEMMAYSSDEIDIYSWLWYSLRLMVMPLVTMPPWNIDAPAHVLLRRYGQYKIKHVAHVSYATRLMRWPLLFWNVFYAVDAVIGSFKLPSMIERAWKALSNERAAFNENHFVFWCRVTMVRIIQPVVSWWYENILRFHFMHNNYVSTHESGNHQQAKLRWKRSYIDDEA